MVASSLNVNGGEVSSNTSGSWSLNDKSLSYSGREVTEWRKVFITELTMGNIPANKRIAKLLHLLGIQCKPKVQLTNDKQTVTGHCAASFFRNYSHYTARNDVNNAC